ncbi:MAG: hypothetical protein RLZZ536_170 [Planctomycetota bacterium]
MGYQEFGLIVPRHPANPREVAGLAVGLHSESPGIGAEPVSGPGSVVSCQLSGVGVDLPARGKRVFPTDLYVRDWTCWSPRYGSCWAQFHR